MEVGGAETIVARLCRLQRDSGNRPFIHCFLRNGPLGHQLQAEGVAVSVSRPGLLARELDIWKAIWRIRPDVVHCHNANATIHGAPPARLSGVKRVISTRHGLVPPGEKVVREKRFWIAARFCDQVVAVCDAVARTLELGPRAIPRKIITIRNGAAPAPGGDAAPPDKLGFTLISVARLAEVKDQPTLLRAVSLARPKIPDLQLWLLGDGPMRGELESLISELQLQGCVHLAGERQDAGRWLQAADLFVLSSRSEGLPISVLEAMAAGLPLLLTQVGGMPEAVQLAGGGRTVAPADPEAMARAIVEMASDRPRLRDWGSANRAVYLRQLTDRAMSDSYDQLYANSAA